MDHLNDLSHYFDGLCTFLGIIIAVLPALIFVYIQRANDAGSRFIVTLYAYDYEIWSIFWILAACYVMCFALRDKESLLWLQNNLHFLDNLNLYLVDHKGLVLLIKQIVIPALIIALFYRFLIRVIEFYYMDTACQIVVENFETTYPDNHKLEHCRKGVEEMGFNALNRNGIQTLKKSLECQLNMADVCIKKRINSFFLHTDRAWPFDTINVKSDIDKNINSLCKSINWVLQGLKLEPNAMDIFDVGQYREYLEKYKKCIVASVVISLESEDPKIKKGMLESRSLLTMIEYVDIMCEHAFVYDGGQYKNQLLDPSMDSILDLLEHEQLIQKIHTIKITLKVISEAKRLFLCSKGCLSQSVNVDYKLYIAIDKILKVALRHLKDSKNTLPTELDKAVIKEVIYNTDLMDLIYKWKDCGSLYMPATPVTRLIDYMQVMRNMSDIIDQGLSLFEQQKSPGSKRSNIYSMCEDILKKLHKCIDDTRNTPNRRDKSKYDDAIEHIDVIMNKHDIKS